MCCWIARDVDLTGGAIVAGLPGQAVGWPLSMTLHAHVVDGVHRIEHSSTDFYLLEDADRSTLVGAGPA